ncbi:MAG: ABC transporter ATP-binding protein [Hyphomonadaceae bacterium]|nr:ABC transporter ATP-binding protein [Hyphomonadaceae bacterium]
MQGSANAAAATAQAEEPDAEAVLRFEAVSRRFTGFAAVDEITLSLRRNEILTLLGPSGCGKTTTLRMAIGLERCTSGRIVHRGVVVDEPKKRIYAPPEARDMGIVFQSYAIWPHMTVFDNVAFPLRVRKLEKSEVRAKVDAALEMVGLGGLAERLGTQLSGGQQQRVAIARGLVFNPDVLLLDEPFSNLDAKLREQVRVDLRILQRELQLAILFVTHDQTEALALSDRLAIMREGRIEQIGAPIDLYLRPATPFVRDFLGHWVKLSGVVQGQAEGMTRVRLADGEELAASEGALAPGADVVAAVRPEEIEFSAAQGAKPRNVIAGTIKTLLFLGPHYEARIAISNGDTVLVHLPRTEEWREGQQLWLRIAPTSVRLWPAASAA